MPVQRRAVISAQILPAWLIARILSTWIYLSAYSRILVEEIVRRTGHQQTSPTEPVHRRELRPVIATGAEVIDRIFSSQR